MNEEIKNGVKNGENTQFTTDNQPSSEAKRTGWARRKQAQSVMDQVARYLDLKVSELHKLEAEVSNSADLTVRELLALNYVSKVLTSDKFLLHWLDLHVPKARPLNPQDEEDPEDRLEKVIVEIVEKLSDEYDPEELAAYKRNGIIS